VVGRSLIGLIRLYQAGISSWTPATCRFSPTCSGYAIEAIRAHGSARGSWMALRRVARCHPWGGHGYDPVPAAHSSETLESPAQSAVASHR
jgi:uncharacterized protein